MEPLKLQWNNGLEKHQMGRTQSSTRTTTPYQKNVSPRLLLEKFENRETDELNPDNRIKRERSATSRKIQAKILVTDEKENWTDKGETRKSKKREQQLPSQNHPPKRAALSALLH